MAVSQYRYPVQMPEAFSSRPLVHVFPAPGALANATARLLLL
ncbi:hypothetical protein GBAR_LOCUS31720, partial [Geodia barretti]